jgi:hypothetical protein
MKGCGDVEIATIWRFLNMNFEPCRPAKAEKRFKT